ncbi:MAG: LcoC [Firmicutes bacterium]|nr:LcoC [Bacillota bacterium]
MLKNGKTFLTKMILMEALVIFLMLSPVRAATVQIEMMETTWELKPGLVTKVWSYNGSVPGTPIIIRAGEKVSIDAVNHLPVNTNIHWHGLIVPNDQDGPAIVIRSGETFHYEFIAHEAGTYWYHSHYPPVLTQVDMGLYGPFIVKETTDGRYSGDHILVLDDWYLDANGKRLEGTARGDMERYGNVETVNGKTGAAIQPLVFRKGELHKLRFINASSAAVHTLHITGHMFRVTHTDGHPLVEPYETSTITLSPAERLDVEVVAAGSEGGNYRISSDRSDLGIIIPLVYSSGKVTPVLSPFVPSQSRAFAGIEAKTPDFVLELNSTMTGTSGDNMSTMQHSNMNMAAMASMMRWTINGKSYPDTDPLPVAVAQVVKIRFWNKDTEMAHKMDHPMHIHGTYFQVVSINGQKPDLWKDTVNVPAGEYVDVAFVMTNPGDWMLHCHILDHEDAGLMTMIQAR